MIKVGFKKSKFFVFWVLYILNEFMFFGDNVSVYCLIIVI